MRLISLFLLLSSCLLGAPEPCPDEDGDDHDLIIDDCGTGDEESDCDDSNSKVFPGAREDCTDRVDNDCDGEVDADDPDAEDCPTTS